METFVDKREALEQEIKELSESLKRATPADRAQMASRLAQLSTELAELVSKVLKVEEEADRDVGRPERRSSAPGAAASETG